MNDAKNNFTFWFNVNVNFCRKNVIEPSSIACLKNCFFLNFFITLLVEIPSGRINLCEQEKLEFLIGLLKN